VTKIDPVGLDTDASEPGLCRIDARTKIWAVGVEAAAVGRLLAEATGADVDRAGRVQVQPDCTIPGHPEIFVVGDLMSLNELPGVAEVAMQSGRHAAVTIHRRLHGDSAVRPFRYRDLGSMATISRFHSIATIGPVRADGFVGWLMWLLVHLMVLTGFKNRVAVVATWLIAFIGRGRPQRAITAQQVLARRALSARDEAAGPPLA
jgi:NADH:ubiquinone reductase (H+-translocating)